MSIRWHRDRTVTVLLPLQGHKTSYDTDRNSRVLVRSGQSETRGKTPSEAGEGSERSERETRASHMIVCVADHHDLAFTHKCTFVEKREEEESGPTGWLRISSCGDIAAMQKVKRLTAGSINCLCRFSKW